MLISASLVLLLIVDSSMSEHSYKVLDLSVSFEQLRDRIQYLWYQVTDP